MTCLEDCSAEYSACIASCNSDHEGRGFMLRVCYAKCAAAEAACIAACAAKATGQLVKDAAEAVADALSAAARWLHDHPEVFVIGAIIVVAGVVFVITGGTAAAPVLAVAAA